MKKIKILTVTLLIVLIVMVAFFGVYVQETNSMKNKVEDYKYAMDLYGTRTIRLIVDDTTTRVIKDSEGNIIESATEEEIQANGYTEEEVKNNSEEILNKENYNKCKKILEKRLEKLGIDDYIIRLDEETGDILIDLIEKDTTDVVVSNIASAGKFEIVDKDTNEVLLDNSHIKTTNVMYGSDSTSTSSGTSIYLSIEFNKEGTKILEEITQKYTPASDEDEASEESDTTEDVVDEDTVTENTTVDSTETENQETEDAVAESTEDETTEETSEDTEKQITMKIDDEEIMSTSFEETIRDGKLRLSVGYSTTDTSELQNYAQNANVMSSIIDSEYLPITYNLEENQLILSDITNTQLMHVEIAMVAVAIVMLIILIFRYKSLGLLSAISYIGFMAIYTLTIRYTNVQLSINSIFAIGISLILNYILNVKILSKLKNPSEEGKKIDIKNAFIGFIKNIIPITIISVVFCFIDWTAINTYGTTMFWGLALILIYNILITKNLLKWKSDN